MSKIKVPKIQAVMQKSSRHAFDLSQQHLFTAPVGALLPVMTLDCMGGDHLDVSITDFMRVMPMNSAAFVDAKGVYEAFFVPYSQLWHQYDQFRTSMHDYPSAFAVNANGLNAPANLPNFDIMSTFSDWTGDTHTDAFGYSSKLGFNRLSDLLGYGRFFTGTGATKLSVLPQHALVSPFRFLAYQKIYNDVYRNTQYEQPLIKAFNIDDLSGTIVVHPKEDSRALDFVSLRYRNYGLDLLSNIRPTQVVDSVDVASLNALNPYTLSQQPSGSAQPSPLGNSDEAVGGTNTHVKSVGYTGGEVTGGGSITVTGIRAMFAYDKLLSLMGRAPKTFRDQMKAIYGVDIKDSRGGKVRFCGGMDSPFQFGDVANTGLSAADTSASSPYSNGLGASVSKGTAGSNGRIKFDCSEDGIFMVIYSVIPQSHYDSTRIDPMVQKYKPLDFFNPAYDHLGMQPLYQSAITMYASDHATTPANNCQTNALGWQPRYSEYKTAIDLNHGQFCDGEPLSYFTTNRARNRVLSGDWLSGLTFADLKINPNIFDSVFKVHYNGQETTDPFFGSASFNVTKVSNMDITSMPNI